jgi:hypothetical protein
MARLVFLHVVENNTNMKKTGLLLTLLLVISTVSSAWAYDSGIALVTEEGMKMQVFVNGKLYNKNPGKYVRVRSVPGLFHVEVRVLSPYDKRWYSVKKDIRAEKGFELQYKVVFVNSRPQLVDEKKHPIYSRYFLNPSLYNKHPIT